MSSFKKPKHISSTKFKGTDDVILHKSTDTVSWYSVRIRIQIQNRWITEWDSQFKSIIFNVIGFIFLFRPGNYKTNKWTRWRNKTLVRIIFAGMSGLFVWDTYILHSWAIGNTERRETAGDSTAVTSPVKKPRHNLTMAWPDNTVTTPVQTNNTQNLSPTDTLACWQFGVLFHANSSAGKLLRKEENQ